MSRTTIVADRNGRVTCQAAVPFDLTARSVWGQVREFARYAAHDYFHHDVRVEGGVPRQGAGLRLSHRYAGVSVERVGRILLWREGVGFAFSDLSLAGARAGFPHVFALRIESVGERRSVVHLSVRGRWTARRVPLWARRAWLRWVFSYVVVRTRNELLAYQIARGSPGLVR